MLSAQKQKLLFHVLFFIAGAIIVFQLNYKPYYNWDILPYMAVVLQQETSSAKELHHRVYGKMEEADQNGELRPGILRRLKELVPYRKACYNDPELFAGELSYYKTKPLYILSIKTLYYLGVDVEKATYIPSLISGVIFLLAVYFWFCLFLKPLWAFIAAASLSQLNIFMLLSNLSAPDAMSAMFIIIALLLIAKGVQGVALWMVLILAVLTRIDNFIPLIFTVLFLQVKTKKQLLYFLAFGLFTAITATLLIPYFYGNSWTWFLQFKFMESPVQYYFHVQQVFRETVLHPQFLLYSAMGLIVLFWGNKKNKTISKIILFSIIIRLMLFPSLQERFFMPYEYAVIIMFAQLVFTTIPYTKRVFANGT